MAEWQAEQIVALIAAVLGSGTLVAVVNGCIQQVKIKAEAHTTELDNDLLEQKIRLALYAENQQIRKDLNTAHQRIRDLTTALAESERKRGELEAETSARLHLLEARLDESEKARILLQRS